MASGPSGSPISRRASGKARQSNGNPSAIVDHVANVPDAPYYRHPGHQQEYRHPAPPEGTVHHASPVYLTPDPPFSSQGFHSGGPSINIEDQFGHLHQSVGQLWQALGEKTQQANEAAITRRELRTTRQELAAVQSHIQTLFEAVERHTQNFTDNAASGSMREKSWERELQVMRESAYKTKEDLGFLKHNVTLYEERAGDLEEKLTKRVVSLEIDRAEVRGREEEQAEQIHALKTENANLKWDIEGLKLQLNTVKTKVEEDNASVRQKHDELSRAFQSLPPPPRLPPTAEVAAAVEQHVRGWVDEQVKATLSTTSPPPDFVSALRPLLETHIIALVKQQVDHSVELSAAETKEYADKKLNEIWELMRPIVDSMSKFSSYIEAEILAGRGED